GGIAVLIDPDHVARVDGVVGIDVRENDVSGPGAGPVRVRVDRRLVLEHADRLVIQTGVHPVARGPLPRRRSGSLVPKQDPVLRVPAVECDLVGDVAGELLTPGDRAVVAPVGDLPDVLTRQAQTGGPRHRSVSQPQDVAPPLGEAVELEREAAVEEASFDPDVELLRGLPGDGRARCARAKDAVHRLVDAEEVLVLEGVVETSEIVLPRRNEGAATVVLLGITAGVDLVDLIRDVVLPEGTDVLAVRGLSLHAAQDPDRVRPDVAAVLGDEVQEDTRTPPVILVELGSAISPRSGQQYRLAVRVARLIGPGVERP